MIPDGWKKKPLATIAHIQTGIAKGAKKLKKPAELPYLRVANVQDGYLDLSHIKTIEIDSAQIERYLLQVGDVLLTEGGDFDKLGRGAVWKGQIAKCVHQNHVFVARPKSGIILSEYLSLLTGSQYGKAYFLKCSKQSTNLASINSTQLKEFPVLLPPIPEQTAIADLFSTWDAAIEKTERLIAAKEQCFSVLRERCLQKTRHSKRVKLQAVTHEFAARNGARLGRDSIMAVTKKVGMRPMKEETIAAGIERYKVVRPRAFAYNPMRLNIGSIAMSPFDADVLVSPDYVVFECDESRLLPGYLNHLRFSRHWTNYFESAGNGSVRVRIYYDDLSAFTFDLPPVDVQKRVVDFLDAVGLEIDLLKKQAEAYRRQKRGLMQKLLTGAWRVKVGEGGTDEHGLSPTYTD